MIAYVFVVLCLASYRLTRLVVRDTFPPVLWLRDVLAGGWRPPTEAERRHLSVMHTTEQDGRQLVWVTRWHRSPDWLAELVTCPWCASAYVTGALTAPAVYLYPVPVPWLTTLAVWAVAAFLASKEWA